MNWRERKKHATYQLIWEVCTCRTRAVSWVQLHPRCPRLPATGSPLNYCFLQYNHRESQNCAFTVTGSFSFTCTWSKNLHLYVLFSVISQSQKQTCILITFWSTFSSHVYVQLKLPYVIITHIDTHFFFTKILVLKVKVRIQRKKDRTRTCKTHFAHQCGPAVLTWWAGRRGRRAWRRRLGRRAERRLRLVVERGGRGWRRREPSSQGARGREWGAGRRRGRGGGRRGGRRDLPGQPARVARQQRQRHPGQHPQRTRPAHRRRRNRRRWQCQWWDYGMIRKNWQNLQNRKAKLRFILTWLLWSLQNEPIYFTWKAFWRKVLSGTFSSELLVTCKLCTPPPEQTLKAAYSFKMLHLPRKLKWPLSLLNSKRHIHSKSRLLFVTLKTFFCRFHHKSWVWKRQIKPADNL